MSFDEVLRAVLDDDVESAGPKSMCGPRDCTKGRKQERGTSVGREDCRSVLDVVRDGGQLAFESSCGIQHENRGK